MKKIIKSSKRAIKASEYDQLLEDMIDWLEGNLSNADYEVEEAGKSSEGLWFQMKYSGSVEMMPEVTLFAKEENGEWIFNGSFKYPDVDTSKENYYDTLEYYTNKWADNARYFTRIMKDGYNPSAYEED